MFDVKMRFKSRGDSYNPEASITGVTGIEYSDNIVQLVTDFTRTKINTNDLALFEVTEYMTPLWCGVVFSEEDEYNCRDEYTRCKTIKLVWTNEQLYLRIEYRKDGQDKYETTFVNGFAINDIESFAISEMKYSKPENIEPPKETAKESEEAKDEEERFTLVRLCTVWLYDDNSLTYESIRYTSIEADENFLKLALPDNSIRVFNMKMIMGYQCEDEDATP